jgi:hypothetical protein
MARLALPLPGVAAVLLAVSAAFGQAPQPLAAAAGGPANPALLEMIRLRLEEGANLHPADGIRLEEAKFVGGALRVRGTVVSAEQAEAVRREIESLRPRLERAVEGTISSLDLSTLRVAERIKAEPRDGTNEPPIAGQTGKGGQPAAGQPAAGKPPAECAVVVEEYPGDLAPPPAKGHSHHWWKKTAKCADGSCATEDGMWQDDGPNAFSDQTRLKEKHHGLFHKCRSCKKAAPQGHAPQPWHDGETYYPD